MTTTCSCEGHVADYQRDGSAASVSIMVCGYEGLRRLIELMVFIDRASEDPFTDVSLDIEIDPGEEDLFGVELCIGFEDFPPTDEELSSVAQRIRDFENQNG